MPEFVAVTFVTRHNVYVCMKDDLSGKRAVVHRDIEIGRGDACLDAVSDLLYGVHDFAPDIGGCFKYIRVVLFGNDECMPRIDRHDVEEGEGVGVLVYFFTRDFARDDFAKEAVCVFHMGIV